MSRYVDENGYPIDDCESEPTMTDNEIIKAAEVCACLHGKSCAPCPYYVDGGRGYCLQMKKDVLDLINRQKAEIERLQEMASEIEYMHNFQLERADIVKYVYQTHEILKILKDYEKTRAR